MLKAWTCNDISVESDSSNVIAAINDSQHRYLRAIVEDCKRLT